MDYRTNMKLAKQLLTEVRAAMTIELNRYPTPIAGCDAQFNYLLSERAKVEAALRALDQDVFVPTPRQLNPGDKYETR